MLQAVLQSGLEIPVVRLQAVEPGGLVGSPPGHFNLLADPGEPGQVAFSQQRLLSNVLQPAPSVLPDRLQHPVAGPPAPGVCEDYRLLHQPGQHLEDLLRREVRAAADELGSLQLEAVGEDRQPAPEDAFALGQQLEAPIDRGVQRLVPAAGGPAARAQQPEAIPEPVDYMVHGQRPQAHGGQLDGQRNALEAAAELRDGVRVASVDLEARLNGRRPLQEQLHRVVLQQGLLRRRSVAGRHAQRRHRQDHLALDAERLPAGDQHLEAARGSQEPVEEDGAGVDQVLAVVKHKEQPGVRQVIGEHADQPAAGEVPEAERGGHHRGHQGGVSQLTQLHESGPVGKRPLQLCGHPRGQPRLARPARPGQREKARALEQPPRLGDLPPPPHKAVQVDRQAVPERRGCGGGHEPTLRARPRPVKDSKKDDCLPLLTGGVGMGSFQSQPMNRSAPSLSYFSGVSWSSSSNTSATSS
jgi:hypothetical protein